MVTQWMATNGDKVGETTRRTWRDWLVLIAIGLAAGFFSGLFGVGGGTIIVPLLLMAAHFDVRKASGTSLAAIVATAVVGVITYVASGSVDWLAALLIVVGSVAGAQIGSHLLNRLSQRVLRWGFIIFLLVVIVSLFVVVPSRDAQIMINLWGGIGLVALGLVTGTAAGLLGIGGGLVVVPALILVFGASDLVAKGTSLAMMIPTAVSGTVGNYRRGNVDLPAALAVGLGACATAWLGVLAATWVDPFVGNLLFAAFLLYTVFTMVRDLRMR